MYNWAGIFVDTQCTAIVVMIRFEQSKSVTGHCLSQDGRVCIIQQAGTWPAKVGDYHDSSLYLLLQLLTRSACLALGQQQLARLLA